MIGFDQLSIESGATHYTPISLNGQSWIYNAGGNEAQTLSFKVTSVPNPNLGIILSGDPVNGRDAMRIISATTN